CADRVRPRAPFGPESIPEGSVDRSTLATESTTEGVTCRIPVAEIEDVEESDAGSYRHTLSDVANPAQLKVDRLQPGGPHFSGNYARNERLTGRIGRAHISNCGRRCAEQKKLVLGEQARIDQGLTCRRYRGAGNILVIVVHGLRQTRYRQRTPERARA